MMALVEPPSWSCRSRVNPMVLGEPEEHNTEMSMNSASNRGNHDRGHIPSCVSDLIMRQTLVLGGPIVKNLPAK